MEWNFKEPKGTNKYLRSIINYLFMSNTMIDGNQLVLIITIEENYQGQEK